MSGKQARGYWIMQVPNEIIRGHSGIFSDEAIDLIAGIYTICRPELQRRNVKLAPVTQ
jgi:hypothetical protein